MNLTQLKLACILLPPTTTIMLSGPHGAGKTEWVENTLCEVLGLKRVVTWHPAHAADPGDITGLPDKQQNASGQMVTKFCPPDWMLQDEPVLLLIDEANRGLALVQAAIMQLTNNGTYGNVKLPKGSRIVACINPDDDGDYDVGQMDMAQKDRFAWFKFEPTVQEWLDYAIAKDFNSRVLDYIQENVSQLDFDLYQNKELLEAAKNTGIGRVPSRRSWEKVAHVLDTAEQLNLLDDVNARPALIGTIESLVGTNNAINIQQYLKGIRVKISEVMIADTYKQEWHDYAKDLDVPSAHKFIKSAIAWIKSHESEIDAKIAGNFNQILSDMRPDTQVIILIEDILGAYKKKATWPQALIKNCPDIGKKLASAKSSAT